MRAVIYATSGGVDVLQLVDRPTVEPAPGEVRVRVVRSGINPTDWKRRRSATGPGLDFVEIVPNHDGAGVIDAVGADVSGLTVGDRVWVFLAQHGRPTGTAQEYTVLPVERVVRLPDSASSDVGASLGVPALTAHRALTTSEDGPHRLHPGALDGSAVLVAGGAGAVGNAAIQLARWAGATVISTVSGPRKAELARAHHVPNYRDADVAAEVRDFIPGGVDTVVEVSPAENLALDLAVIRGGGTISAYATDGGELVDVPIMASMQHGLRLHFELLYNFAPATLAAAVRDVAAAVESGNLAVGEEHGLPIHHYPVEHAADAHRAVQEGSVGKVLIDVAST
ncbi:NADPH:quinone reductase [uncultured Jatrophihabitans sp.]|uniref:NADPH:quinone reductase n=1 Tax=uncultured Jatrophihabitans sp. TaxID=1610747 RepID=UPI0035CB806D